MPQSLSNNFIKLALCLPLLHVTSTIIAGKLCNCRLVSGALDIIRTNNVTYNNADGICFVVELGKALLLLFSTYLQIRSGVAGEQKQCYISISLSLSR